MIQNIIIDKQLREKNKKIKEYNENFTETKAKKIIEDILNKDITIKNINKVNLSYAHEDCEMFLNENSIFDNIKKFCKTYGGSIILKKIIENPDYNVNLLNERIGVLKKLNTNIIINEKNEFNAMWLFEKKEKYIDNTLNIVYFNYNVLENLNKNKFILTSYNLYRIFLSPLIGIISPLIYIIIPYIILKFKSGLNIPFSTYIKLIYSLYTNSVNTINQMKLLTNICNIFTFIFYIQGIFNSIEIAKTINTICNLIITKFNESMVFINNSIISLQKNNITNTNSFVINKIKEKLDKIYNIKDYNYTNIFGEQLSNYRYIENEKIKSSLIDLWILDCINAINQFKINNKYSYPILKSSPLPLLSPYIYLKGLKHPCIPNCVENNCILNEKNIIITGPNAGGKSTYIKNVLISLLLSQSICVSNSSKSVITPYKYILSQMNVPDCKGKESLFEAEMYRCYNSLKIIKSNPGFKFIVMDEIFNSTNLYEGISGAYAILKEMSKYKETTILVTTHYSFLTKLEKTKRFKNYNVPVEINNDSIKFLYLIKEGISNQFIALELLKNNGFQEEIILNAIKTKTQLMKNFSL